MKGPQFDIRRWQEVKCICNVLMNNRKEPLPTVGDNGPSSSFQRFYSESG